jgi:hypothetical protein
MVRFAVTTGPCQRFEPQPSGGVHCIRRRPRAGGAPGSGSAACGGGDVARPQGALVEPISARTAEPPPGFRSRSAPAVMGCAHAVDRDEALARRTASGSREHTGRVPDLLVPVGAQRQPALAAVIGTPAAMSGWPPSTGEDHTSTFSNRWRGAAAPRSSKKSKRGDCARSRSLPHRAPCMGGRSAD